MLKWTPEEDALLIANYPHTNNKELQKLFPDRTLAATLTRAVKLKLKKDNEPCHHGIITGDALDLILAMRETPTLIVTDPPYALRGDGDEHAISATVAIVLREAASRLANGGWMLIMCASSWRSQAYMVEAVRGIVEPVRTLTWCKPSARTKARTSGPSFASVQVIAFKKGKSAVEPTNVLDHITAPPLMNGRRAELPPEVADWMVCAYAQPGDTLLDPFAGSGAILAAGERAGLRSFGFEKNPGKTINSTEAGSSDHVIVPAAPPDFLTTVK